ncbi:hypothetical protein DFJ73DRAFT_779376 [Zopfochytrium polystomum]|nr:hypothetical protein DFJ73DRAFT_779376 [Zopfochytrium polystomum]
MERKGTLPSYQQVMELAEEKKDPQACMFLARYFFDGGEYLRGLHFFEEAALAGSIEGAKHAAMIYRSSASFISSLSSKEDMIIIRCGKKARQFMRIAAETGDNSCYLTLGDWYWSAAEDDAQDDDLEFDPNDADLDLTDGFSDILPAPTSADAKAARLERANTINSSSKNGNGKNWTTFNGKAVFIQATGSREAEATFKR